MVVTKDADFVSSHVISGSPARLLLVSTGNTGNDELEVRLLAQLTPGEECLMAPGFVELTGDGLVIHESLGASAAFRSQSQPRSPNDLSRRPSRCATSPRVGSRRPEHGILQALQSRGLASDVVRQSLLLLYQRQVVDTPVDIGALEYSPITHHPRWFLWEPGPTGRAPNVDRPRSTRHPSVPGREVAVPESRCAASTFPDGRGRRCGRHRTGRCESP